MSRDPEAFLAFWFEDTPRDPERARARGDFWFRSSEEADRACARFAGWLEDAAAGRLDAWAEAARPGLALVLLLDQLPRNLHRGTAAAFAHDARALALAERGAARGWDAELSVPETAFLWMPFQHAEDLAAQRRGGRLYDALVARATAPWKPVARTYRDFAREHEALIERFGRFPHRNAVLGREPSAAERAHLAGGGARFGQG